MTDESPIDGTAPEADAASEEPVDPAEPVEPRRGYLRRHWGKLTFAGIILIPVFVFTLWAWIALSVTYSSGERVGWVHKLSRKGWLCKTWEGELQMSNIPGSAPMLFTFSVRNDSIAHAIEAAEGRRVALRYEQHVGVPTRCFGETEYFVVGVRVLGPP
jgi:hypothetical protein